MSKTELVERPEASRKQLNFHINGNIQFPRKERKREKKIATDSISWFSCLKEY